MSLAVEELLRGAVDVHAHSYPELSLSYDSRISNYDWAVMAKECGIRGYVLKSHVWPTVMQAYELSRLAQDVLVMGSVTLNYTVGGLSPTAVALAGELGGKVVFMPTWSSRNDIERSGVTLNRIRAFCPQVDDMVRRENGGVTVLDAAGRVKPEVSDIMDIAEHYGMAVSSGHLSPAETLKLAELAAVKGVRFTFSHPHIKSVAATVEQQVEAAATGAWIEHTFIACMPMHVRVDPRVIAKSIEAVGVDHAIMSSDAFGPWNPPEPELMRMYIATMLNIGFSADEVRKMVQVNPARYLGLATE
ncbi:MAG: DUF6282 family protein [Gracilibacteraceae bacterium]|jgi:hypothetical protein|nr:DUF6282 family protein [Gracilibacteraceae bacterium]